MDKKETRKLLLQKRKEIPKEKKVIYDKEISKKIIESDFYKNATQVLVFASTENEFDTRFIVEKCRTDGKKIFYPICLDKEGKMEFKKVESHEDLAIGMYKIFEPKEICVKYKPDKSDIIIVPCLSATESGYRIGYGKGYYDRFLEKFNGVSICPCYDEMLSDNLPTDKFDMKINVLVTQHILKEVIL
ncbi:MAG: 5-formyltetrahydrofolate cyclo-ligase [Clostridia bacterium]|nr:5-formyltetrahydrofolate cyclo-ligase [Clostridia bacterium]